MLITHGLLGLGDDIDKVVKHIAQRSGFDVPAMDFLEPLCSEVRLTESDVDHLGADFEEVVYALEHGSDVGDDFVAGVPDGRSFGFGHECVHGAFV